MPVGAACKLIAATILAYKKLYRRQIDAVVYKLYGSTEERRVVKGLNREWANYAKDLASLTG